jgi:transcriptional regulator with XRE-family HTH domain
MATPALDLPTLLHELASRRKALRMPIKALVKRSGLPTATINRLLAGRPTRDLLKIAALATALGVEVTFKLEKPKAMRDRQTGMAGILTATALCASDKPEAFIQQQLERKARHLVKLVQGNMALESQAVDRQAIADLIDQARFSLRLSTKDLWYD